jgi:hypothetical protein
MPQVRDDPMIHRQVPDKPWRSDSTRCWRGCLRQKQPVLKLPDPVLRKEAIAGRLLRDHVE